MPAQLLDGKVMAAELEEELKKRVEALKEKGYTPGLTVILVGDDPASQTYVSNKEKACARLGIRSRTLRMPADTTQETLEAAIREANADPSVNGILVQLPLPRHLDGDRALSLILPEQDVDGFHDINAGRLSRGHALRQAALRLSAAGPVETMRRGYAVVLSGGKAVRTTQALQAGDALQIVLADGRSGAQVTYVEKGWTANGGKSSEKDGQF